LFFLLGVLKVFNNFVNDNSRIVATGTRRVETGDWKSQSIPSNAHSSQTRMTYFTYPMCSGSVFTDLLDVFISKVEAFARIGRREARDTFEIAALQHEVSNRVFRQRCANLHMRDALWHIIKRNSEEAIKTSKNNITSTPDCSWLFNAGAKAREFADRYRAWRKRINSLPTILYSSEYIAKMRNACCRDSTFRSWVVSPEIYVVVHYHFQ
jgi:hypothetical protein